MLPTLALELHFGDRAGELGQHGHRRAVAAGVLGARVALQAPRVDALRDRGEAEDAEREEERPALDGARAAPGQANVLGDRLVFGRDPERGDVDTGEPAAAG